MLSRGGQKNKKFDSELADCFFPLYCVSGVTKKKFQLPTFKLWPPSSPLHYTKEISENTKENVKGQNFDILSR